MAFLDLFDDNSIGSVWTASAPGGGSITESGTVSTLETLAASGGAMLVTASGVSVPTTQQCRFQMTASGSGNLLPVLAIVQNANQPAATANTIINPQSRAICSINMTAAATGGIRATARLNDGSASGTIYGWCFTHNAWESAGYTDYPASASTYYEGRWEVNSEKKARFTLYDSAGTRLKESVWTASGLYDSSETWWAYAGDHYTSHYYGTVVLDSYQSDWTRSLLSRTNVGLFDESDGTDTTMWETVNGASVATIGGQLQVYQSEHAVGAIRAVNANHGQYVSPAYLRMTNKAAFCVDVNPQASGNVFGGILGIRTSTGSSNDWLTETGYQLRVAKTADGTSTLSKVLNSSPSTISSVASGAATGGTAVRCKLWYEDNTVGGMVGAAVLTPTGDTACTGLFAFLGGAGSDPDYRYDNLDFCMGNTVYVRNVPTGYAAKLLNASDAVLASGAANASGCVRFDLTNSHFPITGYIQTYTSTGYSTTVDRGRWPLVGTVGDIRGGDELIYGWETSKVYSITPSGHPFYSTPQYGSGILGGLVLGQRQKLYGILHGYEGAVYAFEHDLFSRETTLSSSLGTTPDQHSTYAMCLDSSGYAHAIYGGNASNNTFYRKSTSPYDALNWGSATDLGDGYQATIRADEADNLYIIGHVEDGYGGTAIGYKRYSATGAVWGSWTNLATAASAQSWHLWIHDSAVEPRTSGVRPIHLTFSSYNGASGLYQDLVHMMTDDGAGTWKSITGATISTPLVQATGGSFAGADYVVTGDCLNAGRLHADASGNVSVTYTPSPSSPADLYSIYASSGTAWPAPVYIDNPYEPGCIDEPYPDYLHVFAASNSGLEKYISRDNGATWENQIPITRFVGNVSGGATPHGDWYWTQAVANGNLAQVLWHTRYTSFTDIATQNAYSGKGTAGLIMTEVSGAAVRTTDHYLDGQVLETFTTEHYVGGQVRDTLTTEHYLDGQIQETLTAEHYLDGQVRETLTATHYLGGLVAVPQVLFSDNFNRANSTNLGTDWTEVVGDWSIESNQLVSPSGNANKIATVAGWSSGDDYISSSSFIYRTVSDNSPCVVGRCTDASNFYMARLYQENLSLYKCVGGTYTQLGSNVPISWLEEGMSFGLSLRVVGTTLDAYVAGESVARLTATGQTDLTTGAPGVRSYNGICYFDNFRVENLFSLHPVYDSRAVVALTNSLAAKQHDYWLAVVKPWLDHWKICYAELDVSLYRSAFPANYLASYQCVVAAHDLVVGAMDASKQEALAAALDTAGGPGFVNLDCRLDKNVESEVKALLGITTSTYAAITTLTNLDNTHWVSKLRTSSEVITTSNASALGVASHSGTALWNTSAAASGDAFIVGTTANGTRAVQNMCSDATFDRALTTTTLWPCEFADWVWRSIVWVAKKPFVSMSMPPYKMSRVDDAYAQGSGSCDNWDYIDKLYAQGWRTHAALYINTVAAADGALLATKQSTKGAEACAHAKASGDHIGEKLYWDDIADEELTTEELDTNFALIDTKFSGWGVTLAKTVVPHYYEVGEGCEPYFESRGVRYTQIEGKFAAPTTAASDAAPDNALPPEVGHGDDGAEMFNLIPLTRFSASVRNYGIGTDTDFLQGVTAHDTATAITRGTIYLLRLARCKMPLQLFTHEALINNFTAAEWQTIVETITTNIAGANALGDTSPDWIMQLAHNYFHLSMTAQSTSGYTVSGTPDMIIKLERYTDSGSSIEVSLVDYPANVQIYLGGYVQDTITTDHYVDGQVRDTLTTEHYLDGQIQETLTAEHYLNGQVKDTFTTSHYLGSQVRDTLTAMHYVDGQVLETLTSECYLGGIVVDRLTTTYYLDGIIRSGSEAYHYLGGYICDTFTATYYLGGWVSTGTETTHYLGGYVRDTFTTTHYVDGAVRESFTTTHYIDGQVRESLIATHYLDGQVQEALTVTQYLGGIVREGAQTYQYLGGYVRDTFTAEHYIDGDVCESFTAEHYLDGAVLETLTVTHYVGGQVQETLTAEYYIGGDVAVGTTTTHYLGGQVRESLTAVHYLGGIIHSTIVEMYLGGIIQGLTPKVAVMTRHIDNRMTRHIDNRMTRESR